jgi:hypothetical protein
MNQNESTENVKDSLVIAPLIQKTTKMPTKMEQHNKRCCSNALGKRLSNIVQTAFGTSNIDILLHQ